MASQASNDNSQSVPVEEAQLEISLNAHPGAGGLRNLIENSKFGHVDNPLMHWSRDAVDEVTRAFVKTYSLQDHEALFTKVGRILRDPERWRVRVGDELLPGERTALEKEFVGLTRQPKTLKTSLVMFCFGAVVQGWSQIIANGANIEWPAELGLSSFMSCRNNDRVDSMLTNSDVWKFAIVNASVYFAASFVGCWLSDPLSDLSLGRRAPVFVSAVLIFAAAIGCACSSTWQQLLACRIILGVGMGCKATVLPVYISEIAPSHLRGTLMVNWQVFVALGICLGFASNFIVSNVRSDGSAWRWQNAALCFPTLILLIMVYVCPESPRFQMRSKSVLWGRSLRDIWSGDRGIWSGVKGFKPWLTNICVACFWLQKDPPVPADGIIDSSVSRQDTRYPDYPDYGPAFETLVLLRGSPILAAKELLYTHLQMVVERRKTIGSASGDPNIELGKVDSAGHEQASLDTLLLGPVLEPLPYFRKVVHLWTFPRLRRATGNALVCMLSQQFCGVNVLIFYCTTLYASKDLCGPVEGKKTLALALSFGIGAVNFVCAIPTYWLIHRSGRRSLLLATLPLMTVFMLGACLAYGIADETHDQTKILAPLTLLFMAAYSVGMGPVPFTMSSEVFPLEYRMVGMSLSVSANLLGAGVLALIVPPIYSSNLGNTGLLAIITALNPIAFVFVLLFVRETAGTANSTSGRSGQALSLEELAYIFTVETREYLRFQRTQLLPWAMRYPVRLLRRMWHGSVIPKKPRIIYTRLDVKEEHPSVQNQAERPSDGDAR